MKIIRRITRPVRNRGLRLRALATLRRLVPARPWPGRKLDVYWIDTGRCGTHFVHNVIRTATNVHSRHDAGVVWSEVNAAARVWRDNREAFWGLRLERYRASLAKVLENAKYPCEVYNEISHPFFVFAFMTWDYYQRCVEGRRLKLVHLIRDPVACCRSILKIERDEHGYGFRGRPAAFVGGATSAEKAAAVWNNMNGFAEEVFERVGDPSSVLSVRIEDLDAEGLSRLFDFMELRGFDRDRVERVRANPTARHSHIRRADVATREATDEEIDVVRRLTAERASRYGYAV